MGTSSILLGSGSNKYGRGIIDAAITPKKVSAGIAVRRRHPP
jgi:hypothetical protein